MTAEEELAVVDFIESYTLSGGNLNSSVIREIVQGFYDQKKRTLEESGLVEDSSDGFPSRKWVQLFVNRHPKIKSSLENKFKPRQ